jgi:hypothetical protein
MSYLPPPRLASDDVDVRSPFSVIGSTKRVWNITRTTKPLTIPLAILVLCITIPLSVCWLVIILLLAPITIPWRSWRRSGRNTKKAAIAHKELIDTIHGNR